MDVAAAIELLATVLNTVTNSVAQATQISAIVKGAQAQGRTTLTDDEWALVNKTNSDARAALVQSIQDAVSKALAGA